MAFIPFTKEDQPTMANFNAKFLEAILEGKTQALDAGTKIATGSYTGTGTYGISNPTSLTFDFVPYVVFIVATNNNGTHRTVPFGSEGKTIAEAGLTTSYAQYAGFYNNTGNYSYGKKSADSKTFYWYNTEASGGASYQMNTSGVAYYYLAIG